jgi:hypothetical protein
MTENISSRKFLTGPPLAKTLVTGTTPAPGDRQIHLQYNLA